MAADLPTTTRLRLQLFRCEEYHHKAEQGTSSFLYANTSIQCLTPSWYYYATGALATLVIFILGYPTAVFFIMHYLRQWRKARISLDDAELCQRLIKEGYCIPAMQNGDVHMTASADNGKTMRPAATASIGLRNAANLERRKQAEKEEEMGGGGGGGGGEEH
ncbi:hypothetical protein CYMTET_27674 [Cymbomonas tetramitiformis]|uniref:Uncharacterized protein n=1 Tax=Cymbomonas tetramitiformis TaxID=36881 RepID=A0AAE0FQW6_9CHLO|nr:hypothetical protein CYMTET_27674 [Cymbomonas tetramitiformis]